MTELLSNGPLLAFLGVVIGAIVTGIVGLRVARLSQRTAAAQQQQAAQATEAEQQAAREANTLAWQTFIQKQVADAVEKSNEDRDRKIDEQRVKIEALERAITGVLGELRRVKNWFREYIRKVVSTWNHAPQPPELEQHILESLSEDDLEGLLNDLQVAQYRNQDTTNQEEPDVQ